MIITQTEIERAKAYPIADYLAQKGIFVAKRVGNRDFYISPFRPEKTPSFVVNSNNTYKDFAENEKPSSIIDLVCRLENCSFKIAVEKILSLDFSFYGKQDHPQAEQEPQVSITKVVDRVQNKGLIDYLESRAINFELAKPYIKEVYFKINGKARSNGQDYFAIGFENQEKGFDLRSKFFKGKTQPNGFTYFCKGFDRVAIFEGFFDFLSALTFYQKQPQTDILVLNSTVNLPKTFACLTTYQKINSYLDNDSTGSRAFADLVRKTDPEKVRNQSHELFPEYKDFNEFLVVQK